MCGPTEKMTTKEASVALAELMRKRLDISLSPIALELFIRSEWSKIKLYAHRIHED